MSKTLFTVRKLYGTKKLLVTLTGIFGLLSSAIVLLTYYGQNVGSFSIRLDDALTEKKIGISTDKEFTWFDSRLEAASCKNASTIGYKFIRPEIVKQTDGSYYGTNNAYVGYTFYLKNMGTDAINIEQYISLNKSTKDLDQVVWLWYFEDDEEEGTVYKKEDKNIPDNWVGYLDSYPETVSFLDENRVAVNEITNLAPGEVKKMSIIIWMESLDPDLDESKSGGMINFSIDFMVKHNE